MDEIKPNGQEPTGSERLDRIERELKLMPQYHAHFAREYRHLRSSLMRLNAKLEKHEAPRPDPKQLEE
jgi:hypothetical protein